MSQMRCAGIATLMSRAVGPLCGSRLRGTRENGEKVILARATTVVRPGQKLHFPETGGILVQNGAGKEQTTHFACDRPFPAGNDVRIQHDRPFFPSFRSA